MTRMLSHAQLHRFPDSDSDNDNDNDNDAISFPLRATSHLRRTAHPRPMHVPL